MTAVPRALPPDVTAARSPRTPRPEWTALGARRAAERRDARAPTRGGDVASGRGGCGTRAVGTCRARWRDVGVRSAASGRPPECPRGQRRAGPGRAGLPAGRGPCVAEEAASGSRWSRSCHLLTQASGSVRTSRIFVFCKLRWPVETPSAAGSARRGAALPGPARPPRTVAGRPSVCRTRARARLGGSPGRRPRGRGGRGWGQSCLIGT